MNIIEHFAPHFLRKIVLYPETLIVLASESGLEILKEFGKDIFFIDSTNSLIDGQMQLCGIAVRDNFGMSSILYDIFIKVIKFKIFFRKGYSLCVHDFERANPKCL
jgi:hypothetical protein